MRPEIASLTARLSNVGAVSPSVMDRAGTALGLEWPEDYREFMLETGGGEGWVGPGYLVLWPATELVAMNHLVEMRPMLPRLVGIGSDGGGELFAFEVSTTSPALVMVPDVGFDQAVRIGTFTQLLGRLAADDLFGSHDIR